MRHTHTADTHARSSLTTWPHTKTFKWGVATYGMRDTRKRVQRVLESIAFDVGVSRGCIMPSSQCALRAVVRGWPYGIFKCELSEERDRHTVPHFGDLFVGFLGTGPCTLDLCIGGVHVCSHQLEAGQFRYAVDDRYIVPIISLRFHEITVRFTGHKPELVQAWLDSEERRELAMCGATVSRGDGPLVFNAGMMSHGAERWVESLVQLPDMRAVPLPEPTADADPATEVHAVFTPEQVAEILGSLHEELDGPPNLYIVPLWAKRLLEKACQKLGVRMVGARWTVGNTDRGMHLHRDESYQGGTRTLLVYLTTPTQGGETEFQIEGSATMRVRPVAGNGVLFGVHVLHRSNPVIEGTKAIVAVEVV